MYLSVRGASCSFSVLFDGGSWRSYASWLFISDAQAANPNFSPRRIFRESPEMDGKMTVSCSFPSM